MATHSIVKKDTIQSADLASDQLSSGFRTARRLLARDNVSFNDPTYSHLLLFVRRILIHGCNWPSTERSFFFRAPFFIPPWTTHCHMECTFSLRQVCLRRPLSP